MASHTSSAAKTVSTSSGTPTERNWMTLGSSVPDGSAGPAATGRGLGVAMPVGTGAAVDVRAAVDADPLGEVAHRVRGDEFDVGGDGGCGIHEPVAVDRVGADVTRVACGLR